MIRQSLWGYRWHMIVVTIFAKVDHDWLTFWATLSPMPMDIPSAPDPRPKCIFFGANQSASLVSIDFVIPVAGFDQ